MRTNTAFSEVDTSCNAVFYGIQNRSPKEGRNGVRHENEKEINQRNGKTVLDLFDNCVFEQVYEF